MNLNSDSKVLEIERPHSSLWRYYLLQSLVFPPFFPFIVLPRYFRYRTMRYTFTNEGISMRWGILFRREIIIQYARIQDIHLRSNLVERWLGLAKVLVQTASGNSGAEMTLEGLREFEAVRDFLYSKMRGVNEPTIGPTVTPGPTGAAANVTTEIELTAALREVALELRETRLALQARGTAAQESDRV